MYNQLFKELLTQMKENDQSKVISYCPDLYLEENIYDLIASNPQLLNLTDFMRKKIQDENPLLAMGRLMLEMGSYDRAEYFYLKALPTEEHDWIRQAALLNNLGKVYQEQGKLDLALEYFQRALKIEINASTPDEELIALFNNNIGLIYNDQKNFTQGLHYHEKCLQINQKILPSIALSHHNFAISLFSLGRFDDVLDHIQKAIDITSQSLPTNHPQRTAHQDLINAIQQRMS